MKLHAEPPACRSGRGPRDALPLRAIGIWLLLQFAVPAIAPAQVQFDSWTTENGLPQNSVNDIVQTRDGYMWLATHGGLVTRGW